MSAKKMIDEETNLDDQDRKFCFEGKIEENECK
jgi:hypothetical protein